MGHPRLERLHRGRCAVALTLLLACVAILPSESARAEENAGISETQRLRSTLVPDSNRFVEVDVPARRLFDIGQPSGASGVRVVAYDLDALTVVGALDIPGSQTSLVQRSAVDELRHRLFVIYPLSPFALAGLPDAGLGDAQYDLTYDKVAVFAVAVIDTLRMKVIATRAILDISITANDGASPNNGTSGLKAMTYYAPEDKLYLVTEDSVFRSGTVSVNERRVFVHQLDVATLVAGGTAKDWSYPIPQCASVMGTYEHSAVLRTADPPAVFVPCRLLPLAAFLQVNTPQVETGGIVRLNIKPFARGPEALDFSADFLPISGDLSIGPVVVDPVADRMLLRLDAADISESGIVIFDARSSSLLGKIVMPAVTGLGVDRLRGRLYAIATGVNSDDAKEVSILVASTRGLTIDQGMRSTLRLHAEPDDANAPRVIVDPFRQRLFWPLAGENQDYAVIQDAIPSRPSARPADPDAGTIDVLEGSGTEVNFAGGVLAYGSRVRWVNGTGGLHANLNDPTGTQLSNIVGFYVGADTRDLRYGRLANTTVSNNEASSRAIGAEFDATTAAELDEIARNLGGSTEGDEDADTIFEQSIGPTPEAQCADFSGEPREASMSGASVACDLRKASVAGSAEYQPKAPGIETAGGMVVRIGYSRSSVSSVRDAARGVVSIAEAEARSVRIDVPGTIQIDIGRVYTRAETFARGRPGTAGSAPFQRIVEDVTLRTPDGSARRVCEGPCDISTLSVTFNRVLGTRMRVQFPGIDAARAKGTPGGYEALVVRDPFEQVNDQFVNLEGDDAGLEVPGIQLTIFADGRVSSRVVVYLAATSAESHYGIYLIPDALPPGSPPPPIRVPPILDGPLGSGGPAPGDAPLSGGLGELARRTIKSVKFFFASPGESARAFAFWAFVAAPLLLLRRRGAIGAGPGRAR